DRVFLEVVPFARDVGGDFLAVGKPYTRHLAEGRVRLLRRHRLDLEADPPLEGAALEHRRLGPRILLDARLATELIDRGHEGVVPCPCWPRAVDGAGAPDVLGVGMSNAAGCVLTFKNNDPRREGAKPRHRGNRPKLAVYIGV